MRDVLSTDLIACTSGTYRQDGEAPLDFDPLLSGFTHGGSVPAADTYRYSCCDLPATWGHGRVVYFPWDLARTFWEVLNNDHALLIEKCGYLGAG